MRSALFIALALTLISGCALPEEQYATEMATVSCKKADKCSADFDQTWDSRDACVADVTGLYQLGLDINIFCEYNEDSAKTCLKELKSQNCDQWSTESSSCTPCL